MIVVDATPGRPTFPYGLSIDVFLELIEAGVKKYSHLGHKVQFRRIREDLKYAGQGPAHLRVQRAWLKQDVEMERGGAGGGLSF